MTRNPRLHRPVALLLLLVFTSASFAREPLSVDQGKSGLLLTLRKLRTTGRLMHTAAHPDDEDGGMLTLESRGHGNYCVQMTLTRGEGGQNATGKEFGDELGMLRTLELLEADRYYNADQRFSRVADFGFSKTAAETLQKWDADHTVLPDLVRVIRELKPDVLISRFIGDPSDGHGNHQASGILTREAFREAGDPTKFPEQIKEGLQPWQPKKLYVRARGEDWNVELDVNQTDPILAMSYVAWGWQGLKHQLSQGSANWQMPTRMWTSHYKLADTTIPNYHPGHEKDFFDGIDRSLVGLAARSPKLDFLKQALQELQDYVDQASAVADKDPKVAAVPLLRGLAESDELIKKVQESNVAPEVKSDLLVNLRQKRKEFRDAANYALGVTLKAEAELPALNDVKDPAAQIWLAAVPGETTQFTASTVAHDFAMNGVEWLLPKGSKSSATVHSETGAGVIFGSTISLSASAPYTRQYWHRDDPDRESIYKIDDPQYATLALTPWPFHAAGTYIYQGLKGEVESTVEVPQPKEHPLIVGPAWSVMTPASTLVVARSERTIADTTVSLRTNLQESSAPPLVFASGPGTSQLRSGSISGQLGTPLKPGVDLSQKLTVLFTDHQQRFPLNFTAKTQHQEFNVGYTVVSRPDLGTAYYFRKAVQPVSIVDVNVPKNLKIGYIMGAGDDIPDVLRSLGLNVTLITSEELKSGDLSKYDTIVLGIRSYEAREDLRQNNGRLLDFVKDGGTMMVQYIYNTDQFNEGHFAPYPMTISRNNKDRVTVEEAPVEILDPQNPGFHTPNQITQKDFDGWVQERALYCPTEWDSHYTPLLSSHDPGDPPEKGGLLMAKYGKGTYIFNAWAFFRQLPAGVPGAIRLYVNLLAAGHEGIKK
ncbi:MAG: PIG-L family deacetylase [Terriglobales bacterium]